MKETREETYRKVFIKTEADFPKENGLYFCVDQNRHYIGERSFDKADKINLHIWSGVNWYLQPVTDKEATTEQTLPNDYVKSDITQPIGSTTDFVIQQEKPQTAEDMEQEMFNDIESFVSTYMMSVGYVDKKDVIEHDLREGISIGRIIASKYATQKQPILSAEEILKLGDEYGQYWKKQAKLSQRVTDEISIAWSRGYMACKESYANQKHIPTDCYPKEFVLWLIDGNHPFVRWFDENGHFYTDELTDQRWSLDELYQFWIKEVKHG